MEQLMKFVNRKSHIEYELNSIEKYIHGGDCDRSLRSMWDRLEAELKDVDREIKLLRNPVTKEVELQKLELIDQIRLHEREIVKLNNQIEQLNNIKLVEA